MAQGGMEGGRKVDKAIEDGWKRQVQRVIVLIDSDSFYTQVEVRNDPERLTGKPVGVMQYNPYGDLASYAPHEDRIFNDSNGSLIAVSYEARAFGIKRNMRGAEARKLCPDLIQVQVPTAHGKADLTHYRAASKEVLSILARLSICEKASIDECYLDITEEARRRAEACKGQLPLPVNPHEFHICSQESSSAEQWWQRSEEEWTDEERLLACGAAAVADLRKAVRDELGFSCSAGVANCKILAKLAAGLHKPSQQTVVPASGVQGLLEDLPIPKLRQLGGKLGEEVMRVLNIKTVGELARIPKARLTQHFPDSQACWLHELSHGIDADEVKQRTLPKSIGCGKTFHGKHTLYKLEDVTKWVKELASELEDRVSLDQEENSREPQLVTIHASSSAVSYHGTQISRSGPLRRPTADIIAEDAINLLKKWTSVTPRWAITGLSLVVSKFVAAPLGKSTMTNFFTADSKSPEGQKKLPPKPKQQQRTLNFGLKPKKAEGPPRSQALPNAQSEAQLVPAAQLDTQHARFIGPWSSENTESISREDRDGDIDVVLSEDEKAMSPKTQVRESNTREARSDDSGAMQSTGLIGPWVQKDEARQIVRTQNDSHQELQAVPSDLEARDNGAAMDQSDSVQDNQHENVENRELQSDHGQTSSVQKVENSASASKDPKEEPGPPDIDQEVWKNLPDEIQRELRLQYLPSLTRKTMIPKPPTTESKAKKQRTTKSIANFFNRKS